MNTFAQMCWDSDIDAAVISLNRATIQDRDYWFSTVEIVEQGYDPETNRRITHEGLSAWLERCKAEPKKEHQDAPSITRRVCPQD
jgi:hypothetical protein